MDGSEFDPAAARADILRRMADAAMLDLRWAMRLEAARSR